MSVFSFISHTMVLGAQEQEEEEPAHPPTPDRNTSTATCAVPFINKYLAVARDTGSTDGHAVQQQQRQQHAPRGHSARIEEEP